MYFAKALEEYRAGREFRPLIRKHHEQELRQWIETEGLEYTTESIISIRVNEDCCEACLAMKGQRLTIGYALLKTPLPILGCTKKMRVTKDQPGWCRCNYLPGAIL